MFLCISEENLETWVSNKVVVHTGIDTRACIFIRVQKQQCKTDESQQEHLSSADKLEGQEILVQT